MQEFRWIPLVNLSHLDRCRNSEQGQTHVVDELGKLPWDGSCSPYVKRSPRFEILHLSILEQALTSVGKGFNYSSLGSEYWRLTQISKDSEGSRLLFYFKLVAGWLMKVLLSPIPPSLWCASGYICSLSDVLSSGCCNNKPDISTRYDCSGCLDNGCCAVYEHCVSCCLHPDKVSEGLWRVISLSVCLFGLVTRKVAVV